MRSLERFIPTPALAQNSFLVLEWNSTEKEVGVKRNFENEEVLQGTMDAPSELAFITDVHTDGQIVL